MRWLATHGISAFLGSLAFFVALAIAGWIAIGYGAAIIIGVLMAIWVAVALPPLVMYHDETDLLR